MKVDDMLILMIEPKVREIQERFSKGEGLTNEDINTLLLKSQYNHINHLDAKLNEVTADVASLKTVFAELKADFKNLELKFDKLETNLDLKIQKALNSNIKWSVGLVAFVVTFLKLVEMILAKI
ncbi:MAG: hypothetical protein SFY32_16015 [Bacteroidota bacterium]|nr:hypothetical protein [Bacteroidota bacterium]